MMASTRHMSRFCCLFHQGSVNSNMIRSTRSLYSSTWKWTNIHGGIQTSNLPWRHLSLLSKSCQRETLLPDRIVQSHLPDIFIPEDVPFHKIIFDSCSKHKDKPAVSEFLTGKSYTYEQLQENCLRVASALTKKGYKKGDVILMFSTNQIDYTVLMLAAASLGICFSAANPGFTAYELARQISHCGCKAVFATEVLAPVADEALSTDGLSHSVKDQFVFGESGGWEPFQSLLEDDSSAMPDVSISPKEDIFVLPYSSGTTGLPKGVMLTHYNILANVMQTDLSQPVSPDENLLGLLPLYHIYGMVIVQFGALYRGAHLHMLPKFEPESFMACMREKKITRAHAVPPIVLFMAKHPTATKEDVAHLRCIISGAAPLGTELTEEFKNKFGQEVVLKQAYGLTETSPATNLDSGENMGSIGNLVCNTKAKIVDVDTGEKLGPFEQGEFCVQGPQVMKGYYKNPEATREMIKEDGWLHTGDIGYYNDTGLIYICDRLKELIKYKGSQVAPAELEALLIGHPEVMDACVVGVADDRAGELPKAFVVKKPNAEVTAEDIIKYVEERVTQTKRLRGGVEFISAIPKNPSGKILRKMLRNK